MVCTSITVLAALSQTEAADKCSDERDTPVQAAADVTETGSVAGPVPLREVPGAADAGPDLDKPVPAVTPSAAAGSAGGGGGDASRASVGVPVGEHGRDHGAAVKLGMFIASTRARKARLAPVRAELNGLGIRWT